MTHSGITRRSAIAGIMGAAAAPALAHAVPGRVPREVLGFYYGWYATPRVSGRWAHWRGPTGIEAPGEKPNTDTPRLGMYDSHDPVVLARHASWAKSAGLTGMISGKWTPDSHEDRTTVLLLDAMGAQGLKVSAYLERAPGGAAGAEAILTVLVGERARHPAWLRVDGRPVIFLYEGALAQLPADGWRAAARRVSAHGLPEALLIGDVDPDRPDYPAHAAPLDGTHVYTHAESLKGMDPTAMRGFYEGGRERWRSAARGIRCATVSPGFDDHKMGGRSATIVGRYDGATLAEAWRGATLLDPDWVLVSSFNAWNDGSEIEPSAEWGTSALEANARFAASFLTRT